MPVDEIEISGAERFDIAQLLAKESLLKYVEELFEEVDESFYKVRASIRVPQESVGHPPNAAIGVRDATLRVILFRYFPGLSVLLLPS